MMKLSFERSKRSKLYFEKEVVFMTVSELWYFEKRFLKNSYCLISFFPINLSCLKLLFISLLIKALFLFYFFSLLSFSSFLPPFSLDPFEQFHISQYLYSLQYTVYSLFTLSISRNRETVQYLHVCVSDLFHLRV